MPKLKQTEKSNKRTQRAKPLSLYPLSLTEAVALLLKAQPPPKHTHGNQSRQKNEPSDPSK